MNESLTCILFTLCQILLVSIMASGSDIGFRNFWSVCRMPMLAKLYFSPMKTWVQKKLEPLSYTLFMLCPFTFIYIMASGSHLGFPKFPDNFDAHTRFWVNPTNSSVVITYEASSIVPLRLPLLMFPKVFYHLSYNLSVGDQNNKNGSGWGIVFLSKLYITLFRKNSA